MDGQTYVSNPTAVPVAVEGSERGDGGRERRREEEPEREKVTAKGHRASQRDGGGGTGARGEGGREGLVFHMDPAPVPPSDHQSLIQPARGRLRQLPLVSERENVKISSWSVPSVCRRARRKKKANREKSPVCP